MAVDGLVVVLIVVTLNADNLSIIRLSMPLVISDRQMPQTYLRSSKI
ncbi:hypothetical protein [uncultured Nostoc sp.]